MERVHINAVIDPTTDLIVLVISFLIIKQLKTFIYRQILFLNIIVRMKWQQMKSIGKNLVMKYLKCIFKKLGRLENGSVSKLVSHGFHSLKEIHDKTKCYLL